MSRARHHRAGRHRHTTLVAVRGLIREVTGAKAFDPFALVGGRRDLFGGMPRGLGDGKNAPTITASAKPVEIKIVVAIQIGTAQRKSRATMICGFGRGGGLGASSPVAGGLPIIVKQSDMDRACRLRNCGMADLLPAGRAFLRRLASQQR